MMSQFVENNQREGLWQVQSVDAKGNMTFEYRILSVDLAQKVGDKDEFKYNSQKPIQKPHPSSRKLPRQ